MAHLSPSLAEAVDFFVMRKFSDCFMKCNDVIRSAKSEPENDRNDELICASTSLGIQALAETNQWSSALHFVTDVYGSVALCPSRVLQVSILLHAHVKEYLACQNIVQHWFENPINRESKHCAQVLRVYRDHILVPLGDLGDLHSLSSRCPGLSPEAQQSLLQPSQSEQIVKGYDSTDGSIIVNSAGKNITSNIAFTDDSEITKRKLFYHENDDDLSPENEQSSDDNGNSLSLTEHLERLCCQVVSRVSAKLRPWQRWLGLCLMAVLAVISLVQNQTGDQVSSLGRMIILWKVFFNRIKGLFYNK